MRTSMGMAFHGFRIRIQLKHQRILLTTFTVVTDKRFHNGVFERREFDDLFIG